MNYHHCLGTLRLLLYCRQSRTHCWRRGSKCCLPSAHTPSILCRMWAVCRRWQETGLCLEQRYHICVRLGAYRLVVCCYRFGASIAVSGVLARQIRSFCAPICLGAVLLQPQQSTPSRATAAVAFFCLACPPPTAIIIYTGCVCRLRVHSQNRPVLRYLRRNRVCSQV
jgi:hypothetical protein